jgi:hypothetical protein
MSHRRLDRIEGRLAPLEHSNEELDRAIERGIEELKRSYPEEWEVLLSEIMSEIVR